MCDNTDTEAAVNRLVDRLRRPSNAAVFKEVVSAIENQLPHEGPSFRSDDLGAAILASCPLFCEFCGSLAHRVFGKILLLRMDSESADKKKVPRAGRPTCMKYTRTEAEEIVPEEFCKEFELPEPAERPVEPPVAP